MKYLLLVLFIASISTGCQKTIAEFDSGTDTTKTGGDGSYLPLNEGTYWKYKDSAFPSEITTETVLNITKTINGKSYKAVKNESNGIADTGYFLRNGNDYYFYEYRNISGAIIDVEMLYLKDTATEGVEWTTDAGTVNSFPARCIGKVVEKGISITVEGKNYTNVIHTSIQLQYNLIGSYQTFAVYNYFVAKGIGIVKISSLLEFDGVNFSVASNLFDYSIK